MRWTKFYWILECLWELLKLAIYLVSDMHVHADSFHLYPDRQDLWSRKGRYPTKFTRLYWMLVCRWELLKSVTYPVSGGKELLPWLQIFLVAASISFVNPLRETDMVIV